MSLILKSIFNESSEKLVVFTVRSSLAATKLNNIILELMMSPRTPTPFDEILSNNRLSDKCRYIRELTCSYDKLEEKLTEYRNQSLIDGKCSIAYIITDPGTLKLNQDDNYMINKYKPTLQQSDICIDVKLIDDNLHFQFIKIRNTYCSSGKDESFIIKLF